MEGTMKVAVMTGKKKMEWCEREIPQPGTGELQIKLEYVGVCQLGAGRSPGAGT